MAYCSARRKQKWEELQERKRQEAEALRSKIFCIIVYFQYTRNGIINIAGQRKGLETIKFSLLDSDTVIEKGWGVRPKSRLMEETKPVKKKRESRIKKEQAPAVPQHMFHVDTLERLQIVSVHNFFHRYICLVSILVLKQNQLQLSVDNLPGMSIMAYIM